MSPRLQIVLATVLMSTGGTAIKLADLSASQIACFRCGIAALALLVLIPRARRRWSYRTVLVGLPGAATFLLYVHANRLTTAASAIFLQGTAPLYIFLLGPWLLRERARPRDLAFMAALALGATAFFTGLQQPFETAPDPTYGNILAALSGLTWGLFIMGLRWMQRGTAHEGGAAPTVVCANLLVFVFSLPTALPVLDADVGDWAIVLYLGIFQIALAYVLLTRALHHLLALEASLFLIIEPVLNVLWAWSILGEVPGAWALAGGALILSSTAGKTWLDARAAGPNA